MSGILQNLIERHQGRAATVEPRQRTLFEPDRGMPERPAFNDTAGYSMVKPAEERLQETAFGHEPDQSAGPAIAPGIDSSLSPSTAASPIPSSLPEPRPRPSLDTRLEEILARLAPATPRHPDNQRDNNPVETAPRTLPDIEQLEATIARLAKNQAIADTLGGQAPFEHLAHDRPAIDSPNADPLHQPDRLPARAIEPETPAIRHLPDPVVLPAETGLLQTPDWVETLKAQLGKQTENLARRDNAEPTVNVTIGRIEIRADKTGNDQPAAAAKPAAPSGILSLDEYLKQRTPRNRP